MRNTIIILLIFTGFIFSAAGAQEVSGAQRSGRGAMSMNPDISVVAEGVYEEGQGFQNEIELVFAADIDPYFKGLMVLVMDGEVTEIEEAIIQTTRLPGGFQLKLGKFLSEFSRLNAQHGHYWNFADEPLIHNIFIGENLTEKGVQVSWIAPTPFYLKFGSEILQGENKYGFNYIGDGAFDENTRPRLGILWARTAPNLFGRHALQFGAFAARGLSQMQENGAAEYLLDGHNTLAGADFVYKFSPYASYHGHGIVSVEGGYVYGEKKLKFLQHDDPALNFLTGRTSVNRFDGLYLQTVYGFAPRWRAGLRGETVGLVNTSRDPLGGLLEMDSGWRVSGMVDWTLSEFSRIRLQANHGFFDEGEGRERVNEFFLQTIFSMGVHGAHQF